MRVGFLRSIVRKEEKLLLEELRRRDVEIVDLDDRKLSFDLHELENGVDVVLERCVNHA